MLTFAWPEILSDKFPEFTVCKQVCKSKMYASTKKCCCIAPDCGATYRLFLKGSTLGTRQAEY